MSASQGYRGQPLLVMAVILGSWLAARAFMWEMPGGVSERLAKRGADRGALERLPARALTVRAGDGAGPELLDLAPSQADAKVLRSAPRGGSRVEGPGRIPLARPAGFAPASPDIVKPSPRAYAVQRNAPVVRIPARSALAARPSPTDLGVADRPLLGRGAGGEYGHGRWSADAWLLWRDGSGAAVAPGIASYGRSQAGAVLRYNLDRASASRPTAYLRATGALQSPRQSEVAAGLALRPVPSVPIVLAAEGRVTETAAGPQLRPAAFAVTELRPVALPLGLKGEAYLQAGYVGGSYRTAFVDGQARIDRRVAPTGNGDGLRVGVAVWGGAQRGISRLDAGPSATFGLPLGEGSIRLAADYRIRIAGEAAPASGPALTLSAGF